MAAIEYVPAKLASVVPVPLEDVPEVPPDDPEFPALLLEEESKITRFIAMERPFGSVMVPVFAELKVNIKLPAEPVV